MWKKALGWLLLVLGGLSLVSCLYFAYSAHQHALHQTPESIVSSASLRSGIAIYGVAGVLMLAVGITMLRTTRSAADAGR